MSAPATSCSRSVVADDCPEVEMPVASEMRARLLHEIEARVEALRVLDADHIALCALRSGINRLRARTPATRRG